RLKGEGQREAIEAMGDDIDNLRACWSWAVTHVSVEALQHSLQSLYLFYRIRGRFQEGAEAFAQAAEALEGGSSPQLLGAVLARLGASAEVLGQFDRAKQLLERSCALLRA